MAKNIIPEIAKLLSVEIGEEFKLEGIFRGVFRFSDKQLEWKITEDKTEWGESMSSLGTIVTYNDKIVKLPWKPKVGENYFTYFGTEFTIVDCSWQEFATQYSLLKNGCIFRTEEEALKKRPEIYKELTGKDWSDK